MAALTAEQTAAQVVRSTAGSSGASKGDSASAGRLSVFRDNGTGIVIVTIIVDEHSNERAGTAAASTIIIGLQ
jgi:hypothetical protein